jgi:hypothetical protein
MQLNGRLGNQLFLWAYAHELASVFEDSVQPFIDQFHFSKDEQTIFNDKALLCERVLPLIKSDFSGFLLKVLDKLESQRNPLAQLFETRLGFSRQRDAFILQQLEKKPTLVTGYFINAEMVSSNSNHLLSHLSRKFEEIHLQKTKFSELIDLDYEAIHIRRGDYKTLINTFGLLDLDWYQQNLSRKNPLVIATDDLAGSREIIKKLRPDFLLDPEEVSPWQTLKILSSSKRLIMANSTFSWWAGYIASEKDNEVIFPKPFYKSEPWKNEVLEFPKSITKLSSFEV